MALGRHLFYDQRLSRDGSMACASCHEQARAFTDGKAVSKGVTGEFGTRSAMSLANVAYLPVLTWQNPQLKSLEVQSLIPLFGEHPVEMGLAGREQQLFAMLQADPVYGGLFARAFPDEARQGDAALYSLATLTRALASFQRTLLSFGSPYDLYRYGGRPDALSAAAKRGEELFFGEKLECYHCHGGFNFTDNLKHARTAFAETGFHNTGLYNVDGRGAYPSSLARHRRIYRRAARRRALSHADAAQRGGDRALHARRLDRHAAAGASRALCAGRPLRDAGAGSEPAAQRVDCRLRDQRRRDRRPGGLPGVADRRGLPARPAVWQPLAGACPVRSVILRLLNSRCITSTPPSMRRTHRHLIAWIAAIAVLLGVVAPSMARALSVAPDAGMSLADICTGNGFARLAAPGGDRLDGGDPVAAIAAFDCPCCTTHGNALALPPALQATVPAAAEGLPSAQFTNALLRAPAVWASARPRGPPSHA